MEEVAVPRVLVSGNQKRSHLVVAILSFAMLFPAFMAASDFSEAAAPDLIVLDIWWENAASVQFGKGNTNVYTVTSGEPIIVHVQIKNQGNQNIGSGTVFHTKLYLDGILKYDWVDSSGLAKGASREYATTYNSECWISGVATHPYNAFVDSNLQIGESNENNNQKTRNMIDAAADWTFIMYMCASSNLGVYLEDNLANMMDVGSNGDLSIAVLADMTGDANTNAYYIRPGAEYKMCDLNVINPAWGQEVDMGDASSLTSFGVYCVHRYTANKYGVILYDHGGGIQGAIQDDNWPQLPSPDSLLVKEIGSAMSAIKQAAGHKIDLLGFDCCNMQTAEVAYQVKDSVSVMVASEAIGWNWHSLLQTGSWPYYEFLTYVKGDPSVTAAQVGTRIADVYIDSYNGPYPFPDEDCTCSVIDLTKMDTLAGYINSLAQALVDGMSTDWGYRSLLNTAFQGTQTYPDFSGEEFDLYSLAGHISYQFQYVDETVQTACTNIENLIATGGLVIFNRCHGDAVQYSYGLAIFCAQTRNDFDAIILPFRPFSFYDNTKWDEFIQSYCGFPVVADDFDDGYANYWQMTNTNPGGSIGLDASTGNIAAPSLRMIKSSDESGLVQAILPLKPDPESEAVIVSNGVVAEARLKVSTVDSWKWYYFNCYFQGSVKTYLGIIDGYFRYYAYESYSWIAIAQCQANVWYDVALALDLPNGLYDVYLGGDLKVNDATLWNPNLQYVDAVGLQVGTQGDLSGMTMWADDVTVRTGTDLLIDSFGTDLLARSWSLAPQNANNYVTRDLGTGVWSPPSMELVKGAATSPPIAKHTFTAQSQMVWAEARLMVSTVTNARWCYFNLYNGPNSVVHFYLGDGGMSYYSAGQFIPIGVTCAAGVWYDIGFSVDLFTGTYDIFVNGMLKYTDARFFDGVLGQHTVDTVYFQACASDQSGSVNYWVDDVVIVSPMGA